MTDATQALSDRAHGDRWEHINLTGTYAWGEQPSLVDGFRPLRLPQPLAQAACLRLGLPAVVLGRSLMRAGQVVSALKNLDSWRPCSLWGRGQHPARGQETRMYRHRPRATVIQLRKSVAGSDVVLGWADRCREAVLPPRPRFPR